MITVNKLSKSFGTVKAVEEASFTCSAGEVFGLLGENGAGKTTTLRMLATMLRPDGGWATVGGHDVVREQAQVRSLLGVLSAETGLYDRMSPGEIFDYFGRLYGMDREEIRRRTDEVVEILDLGDYLHRRTAGFSRGMKQKVNIARAIFHDPPVLLLDEPTAGLDVMSAKVVKDFILLSRRQGKTIVLSSHTMSEVEQLCDNIGIIHEGRMLATDSVVQLKRRYGYDNFEELFICLVSGAGEGA